MAEAARLPYSISKRTLFLSLKSRSWEQSSDLTCIQMAQRGRYKLCQIHADGRIRKKSKTLGFKARFVEEVLASHSKTTYCSFASRHVLLLVALTCPCYSCTPFLNIHPLQFKSHFHYNRFLFSSSPPFLVLPVLSSAYFSAFLHVLLDCSSRNFLCPASQLYL